MPKFEIGDFAWTLLDTSAEAAMLVTHINVNDVKCVWFSSDGRPQSYYFPHECLMAAEKEQPEVEEIFKQPPKTFGI